MSAIAPFQRLGDAVAEHARGALAAQKALDQLRAFPELSDGVLFQSLVDSGNLWRQSADWLRGWCREVEKRVHPCPPERVPPYQQGCERGTVDT